MKLNHQDYRHVEKRAQTRYKAKIKRGEGRKLSDAAKHQHAPEVAREREIYCFRIGRESRATLLAHHLFSLIALSVITYLTLTLLGMV